MKMLRLKEWIAVEAKKHGVAPTTIFNWLYTSKRYVGLTIEKKNKRVVFVSEYSEENGNPRKRNNLLDEKIAESESNPAIAKARIVEALAHCETAKARANIAALMTVKSKQNPA